LYALDEVPVELGLNIVGESVENRHALETLFLIKFTLGLGFLINALYFLD
jgi:hypothetical protein